MSLNVYECLCMSMYVYVCLCMSMYVHRIYNTYCNSWPCKITRLEGYFCPKDWWSLYYGLTMLVGGWFKYSSDHLFHVLPRPGDPCDGKCHQWHSQIRSFKPAAMTTIWTSWAPRKGALPATSHWFSVQFLKHKISMTFYSFNPFNRIPWDTACPQNEQVLNRGF